MAKSLCLLCVYRTVFQPILPVLICDPFFAAPGLVDVYHAPCCGVPYFYPWRKDVHLGLCARL